ncbi:transcriptional regulator, GntR family [Poseidonocella pacifica]|uniref:Transcriptional regulator, GntR family n=1 Tax=Poseidonocella pacifica TaxID=871651 RepID=A0A1I0YIL4_9RHOB|nr:FCD domain-containing protein [Poseidonocella pacifica]SFB11993.1 transcriptional regulator, GntR family [Poseidonocella pacifica]
MQIRTETTQTDDALTALTAFIAEGGYHPGDRLPPERELIGNLGMSRTTLRKALDTLEREGRIWRHVGKGTFVAAHGGATGEGSLAALAQQVTPVQLMRARLAVEPAITREAALHASAEALVRIKRAEQLALEAENWDDYEAQDDLLHRAIAEASDNVLLVSLFDQLNQVRRAVAWNSVIRHSHRPPRDHTSFAEHERLVAAIEARNPAEAQNAMRAHLSSVSARLFGEY